MTETLLSKQDISQKIIHECLDRCKNPIVLCSFGKDSLVLLHLIMKEKKVPVLYFREHSFPKKHLHAQTVASSLDIDMYDYPPTLVDYIQCDDYFEVFNLYYIAENTHINLFAGTRNYTDKDTKFLCAIDDWLFRPKVPSYDFKWDCIFSGHKKCDDVAIIGKVDLPSVKSFKNGVIAYPIADWSDDDIWEYIHENKLPYNRERYDSHDERFNNDKFPTCHDCLDYRKGKEVFCPKKNKFIPVVGRSKEQNEEFRQALIKR